MDRKAEITRTTKETGIRCSLDLDGDGGSRVGSGNGFFDHMLTLMAKHGLFGLTLDCTGDLDVDFHHSAEDIGICLGQAIDRALGTRAGITRFGTAFAPMDESLARVCCDISGRATMIYSVNLPDRSVGTFECDLAYDFFKSLSDNANMTIHIDLLRGRNSHHSLEAVFKAFGLALSLATRINPRATREIPSTKGIL